MSLFVFTVTYLESATVEANWALELSFDDPLDSTSARAEAELTSEA